MAKLTPTSQDNVLRIATAALAAANDATPATAFAGRTNLHITGVFTGSLVLERSMDGGTSWAPCTSLGTAVAFTGPASEVLLLPEADVLCRVRAATLTAGAAMVRLSQ